VGERAVEEDCVVAGVARDKVDRLARLLFDRAPHLRELLPIGDETDEAAVVARIVDAAGGDAGAGFASKPGRQDG
jgi:hypothetical protein